MERTDSEDDDAEPEPSAPSLTLAELYGSSFAPMVRLARLLVGSPEAAADIVQDAFVHVQRRWDRIRSPEPYLRQAVANGCRAHHRRRALERRTPWPRPEPETLTATELLDAVAHLPYRERAALVLRFYADLPDAEIAELLGCRVGTVASLVHRGLARVRSEIDR